MPIMNTHSRIAIGLIACSVAFSSFANQVRKSLTLNAYISVNQGSDAIRIEADRYNYTTVYHSSANKFDDVVMPFRVYSTVDYQIDVNQFYYRCYSDLADGYEDLSDSGYSISFDGKTDISFESISSDGGASFCKTSLATSPSDCTNDRFPKTANDINSESASFTAHQFRIQHGENTDSAGKTCQGMLGVMARGGL